MQSSKSKTTQPVKGAPTNAHLETAARRFEELFQNLPIACFGCDADGMILEWNRAFESLVVADAAAIFGKSVFDLVSSAVGQPTVKQIIEGLFSHRTFESVHLEIHKGDTRRHLACSAFPVHAAGESVVAAMFSCVDVSAQHEYERMIEQQMLRINDYAAEIEQQKWELQGANIRLQALASTDGLTGVLNHRAFQEALARDVKRARREGAPLSLLLLDLDNFKSYNDAFGHPAGDEALKMVADALLGAARESDLIARYGGEEFVVILPSTCVQGSTFAAERMRAAIESVAWPLRQLTASFGVASLLGAVETAADLIRAADESLYVSKRSGGNEVTHWSSLAEHTPMA